MELISLADLAPIIAAILGPMLAFVVVSMRYQHQDSAKTRELIEQSSKENRELIEQSSKENKESIREVTRSLADARERLARIEGYLRIAAALPSEEDGGEGAAA